MIKLTWIVAFAGLLGTAACAAAQLCPACQSVQALTVSWSDNALNAFLIDPAEKQYGARELHPNTMPELSALLKMQSISRENLIKQQSVIEAYSSSGAEFAANGSESLISPYANLPGILTFSADPIAANSSYQAPILNQNQIPPILATALIFIIDKFSSRLFQIISILLLFTGLSAIGLKRWHRSKRDAQLRALGLKRIRVRKKHKRTPRHKAKRANTQKLKN
jgi:hypothetical protein